MSVGPFSLIPADDPQSTPDQDLSAAITGALSAPLSTIPVTPEPEQPLGRTWIFDFEAGQFARAGGSPAETNGLGAVEQWCQMAIKSARFAHPVFSQEFGMEEPDSIIGEFALGEALAEWEANLIEALLVHERITTVENFDLLWDPSTGILTINSFDVITDEDEAFTVNQITLQADGGAV